MTQGSRTTGWRSGAAGLKRGIALVALVALVAPVAVTPVLAAEQEPGLTEQWHPVPPVVSTPAAHPPSDAQVLFDGKNLNAWVGADGQPARWKIERGAMVVTPGSGTVRTRDAFGDVQLHIEWRTPSEAKGKSQGRGNSGVFLMGLYEVQILDSYENETYVNGQAASIYKQYPPQVNASRPPGEWQTYDIVFIAPRISSGGQVGSPARLTVFHNGVLVQHDVALRGPTVYSGEPGYKPHAAELPLELQDHGDRVAFRNIWIRKLPTEPPSPIVLRPANRIQVQRGFVPFEGEGHHHAVSVGTPSAIHYAYDVESASLLQAWRGPFLDVTEMWHGRGMTQEARAAGRPIRLSSKPFLANVLYSERTPEVFQGRWPTRADPLAQPRGYRLEADGQPVFLYEYAGVTLEDRIAPLADRRGLSRHVRITGKPWLNAMWLLLADASARPGSIEAQADGTWLVAERGYRIQWPQHVSLRPQLVGAAESNAGEARNVATDDAWGGRQLAVRLPVDGSAVDLEYALLW